MAEPLGVLVLPSTLEEFELTEHARGLMAIPRVIALEPARFRTPPMLRDVAPARQAKRLRFPGEPRLLVLYHPRQYPLARALDMRYKQAELWYVAPDPEVLAADPDYAYDHLDDFDRLARERATEDRVLAHDDEIDEVLQGRLRELEIISSRPFVPSKGMIGRRRRRP